MSKNRKIIVGIVIFLAALGLCGNIIGFSLIGMSGLYLASTYNDPLQYFTTVNELISENSKMINKPIRISGVVIGESIEVDKSGTLSFFIADIPGDYETVEEEGGLAIVLENAVNDPNRQRIQVVYVGEKPELLRNMAQAIMTGELHSDGVFYADEILLKCPSRYEEAVPDQAIN